MRQVAVILHGPKHYGVSTRQRFLGFLWWQKWKCVMAQNKDWAWPYKKAREIADQVAVNGVVPCDIWIFSHCVYPVIELDCEDEQQP